MLLRLHGMPTALRSVAFRALDVEAASRRSARSLDTIEDRERLLRETHAALDDWSRGVLTEDEAIARIEKVLVDGMSVAS
jgi:hypothetical protein